MPKFLPKIEFVILSVLLIFNVVVTIHDITNPGVEFDEVLNACGTIGLLKKTEVHYSSVSVPFFDRFLPVMCAPYHPSLESYLLIPAFLLFNINVFALRITPIMYSLLALVITYAFAKQFFSRSVSLITMLLLATNPVFIFSTKVGNWASSYQAFFAMAALYSFLMWHKGEGLIYYLFGTLLLGLGSCTRGWFLIVVVGAVVAAMVFYKEILVRIRTGKCKSSVVFLCLGLVFFCVGNFLFIYANFINTQSRFITFKWIAGCLRHTDVFGIDNLNFASNIWLRFRTLWAMVGQNQIPPIYYDQANKWYIYGFIFSIAWLVFSLFFKQKRGVNKKRVLFMFVFLASAFFASIFTVSYHQTQHLFALLPVITILISAGLVAVSRFFTQKAIKIFVRSVVMAFLIFLTAGNVKGIIHCYALSNRTGGISQWSDAIYSLADWLKTSRHSAIFSFDHGFERVVFFLFEGNESIRSLFGGRDQAQDVNNVVSFCNRENSKLYRLCNNNGPLEIARVDLLKKTAVSLGKTLIEEKVFYQRDGSPAYSVYSVK